MWVSLKILVPGHISYDWWGMEGREALFPTQSNLVMLFVFFCIFQYLVLFFGNKI